VHPCTCSWSTRREFLAGLAAICTPGAQRGFDAKELAGYRLTPAVFKRFAHATRLIAAIIEREERFEQEPLFTREISVAGDAPEMASALEKRLDSDAALSSALFAADISAHDYAAFAISLFAARLAQGFLKSGAMRRVPAGIAADNVAFVDAHAADVAALLKQLKLE
jgi:hypothetical protein